MEDSSATAQSYFVGVAVQMLRRTHGLQAVIDCLVDRAEVATALAELPADLAWRASLNPNLFEAEA